MDLNDRAKAYEKKFANENELEFHARTKAYRQLIRWAAEEKLRLDGEKAQAFCDEMILFMVRTSDQSCFFKELQNRLMQKDVSVTTEQMQKMYQENLARAQQELKSE